MSRRPTRSSRSASADGRPQHSRGPTARRGSHDSDDRRQRGERWRWQRHHSGRPGARPGGVPGARGQDRPAHRGGGRGGGRERARGAHRRRAGDAPPAGAAGPRGVVEGRPGDQRHHGRRGPAAAPVPRDPRRGHHARRRPVHPRRAARGRHLGHLPRRAARTLRHHRGVRGPAAGRGRPGRPAHGPCLGLDPGPRRARRLPRLHPHLARPLRLVELGPAARTPARAGVPAVLGAAEHLRLRLLGPPDHRPAHRGLRDAPRPPGPLRAGRAAHRRP